jgi:hypothetical protein
MSDDWKKTIHRNKLLGMWAAEKLGITGQDVSRATECPLLGVKRTSIGRCRMSASDPKRTLGHMVELRFPRVPLQLHGELGLRHFRIWINSRSSRTICYQRRIGILTRYAAKLSNKASSVGATLTEYRVVDKFETSIATMTPTARQRRLTLVLAAAVRRSSVAQDRRLYSGQ